MLVLDVLDSKELKSGPLWNKTSEKMPSRVLTISKMFFFIIYCVCSPLAEQRKLHFINVQLIHKRSKVFF